MLQDRQPHIQSKERLDVHPPFKHIISALFGQVAQSVEQRTENPCVGGSIPPLATTI